MQRAALRLQPSARDNAAGGGVSDVRLKSTGARHYSQEAPPSLAWPCSLQRPRCSASSLTSGNRCGLPATPPQQTLHLTPFVKLCHVHHACHRHPQSQFRCIDSVGDAILRCAVDARAGSAHCRERTMHCSVNQVAHLQARSCSQQLLRIRADQVAAQCPSAMCMEQQAGVRQALEQLHVSRAAV